MAPIHTTKILLWIAGIIVGVVALIWLVGIMDRRVVFFVTLAGGLVWLRILNSPGVESDTAATITPALPQPREKIDSVPTSHVSSEILSPEQARQFLDTFLQDQQR